MRIYRPPRPLSIQLYNSLIILFSSLRNVLYSIRAIYPQIQIEFILFLRIFPKASLRPYNTFPIFLSLLYTTSYTLQELYTLKLDRIYIYSFKSSLKPLRALILRYIKTTTIKMVKEPKSLLITMSIITLVREQLTIIQQAFIDALAQQQAVLEAQHQ